MIVAAISLRVMRERYHGDDDRPEWPTRALSPSKASGLPGSQAVAPVWKRLQPRAGPPWPTWPQALVETAFSFAGLPSGARQRVCAGHIKWPAA